MCFVKEKYKIKGWTGKIYGLTAKDLYERVLQDSQSDYNWIASASELVRTCNDPTFPERYAQDIKRIILNCFANLELKRGYTGETAAMIAVYDCYHSLPNTEEMFIKTKRKLKDKLLVKNHQW